MTTIDLMRRVRRLETALSARMERAAARVRSAGPREPLEIAHAIVEDVARHVQPGGRGRYAFPFTRLKVSVVARDKASRARLEAVLDGTPSLHDRIAERLGNAGCDVSSLDVKTAFVPEPGADWSDPAFHVEGSRSSERVRPSVSPEPLQTTLKLTVEHGKADKSSYTFNAGRVDLGRGSRVLDRRERLIRTNNVAFVDSGDVAANASVSRQHAHITYDAAAQHHRLCDDRSAHGTGILRGGRLIAVPAGARGIRLHAGDVILLGEARLRVTLVQG